MSKHELETAAEAQPQSRFELRHIAGPETAAKLGVPIGSVVSVTPLYDGAAPAGPAKEEQT